MLFKLCTLKNTRLILIFIIICKFSSFLALYHHKKEKDSSSTWAGVIYCCIFIDTYYATCSKHPLQHFFAFTSIFSLSQGGEGTPTSRAYIHPSILLYQWHKCVEIYILHWRWDLKLYIFKNFCKGFPLGVLRWLHLWLLLAFRLQFLQSLTRYEDL